MEISVEEFAHLQNTSAPYHILDVREPWEQEIVSFPNAICISMVDLPTKYCQISKDDKIIVVCHHGIRSYRATLFLRQMGYTDILSLAGGIDKWAQEKDITMARY